MRVRYALPVLVAVLLSACDGYPDGWAGIDRGFLGLARAGCPDLAGTYRLSPSDALGPPYTQSVIERAIRNRPQRWRWETMTVAGRASDSLLLTVRRSQRTMDAYRASITAQGEYYERQYQRMHSPEVRWQGAFARMTDDAFERNLAELYLWPEARLTIVRGRDYECARGWVTADRVVHDPGPDRSRPRPDTVIGTVRIARDKKGYLVFNGRYPEAVEYPIWCGDGCKGIPLGTWDLHSWSHLAPAEPETVAIVRPWAAPFAADTPPPAPARFRPLPTPEEVRTLFEPFVKAPLELRDVRRAGSSYDVIVRSGAGTAAFAPMFEPVARSYLFPGLQVKGLAALGNGTWELTVRVVPQGRRSATAPATIEARLRALLPPGVVLERIRPSGTGFHVNVDAASEAAFAALLRAIARDPGFEEPDVTEADREGSKVRALIWVRARV